MGYAHGIRWTDQMVKEAVFEVVGALELDRMPSLVEMEEYYGNTALTNKISKTGGFYHYADMYGLKVKDSESAFGLRYEKLIRDILIVQGHDVELTTTRFPYDLLVNGRVKIDVKAGKIIKSSRSEYYTFHLRKTMQTCDIYAVVTLDESDEMNKIYIIPASVMTGKSQLSIGITKSQYDKYIDRWDYIDTLDRAFESIESGQLIRTVLEDWS